MVRFQSDGKRMVRKTNFFLEFVWKCLVFSQNFWSRYLIVNYLSCIRFHVSNGVLTAFMLYSETYCNFEKSHFFEEKNYKESK